MANINIEKEGIIIWRIATHRSTGEEHQSKYKSTWIEVKEYFITEINDEIKKHLNNNTDTYCNYIKQVVSNELIQNDVVKS